jgi:hypothetical protein
MVARDLLATVLREHQRLEGSYSNRVQRGEGIAMPVQAFALFYPAPLEGKLIQLLQRVRLKADRQTQPTQATTGTMRLELAKRNGIG